MFETPKIPMICKYLPKDRRDLTQMMVSHSVANLFVVCVRLNLYKSTTFDPTAMNDFATRLFKHTMRRHTHLWDK